MLSLYAKGLTTGEISAHFADVYGASVSKDTVSRITDRVIEEMQAWRARALEDVSAAISVDAIVGKIRDSQVRNGPVYAAIEVDLDGHEDVTHSATPAGSTETRSATTRSRSAPPFALYRTSRVLPTSSQWGTRPGRAASSILQV